MVARAPWVRAGLALPARCRRVPAGPPRGSLPNAPPLPLPSSPALPRRGDASAWGRSGAWARGGGRVGGVGRRASGRLGGGTPPAGSARPPPPRARPVRAERERPARVVRGGRTAPAGAGLASLSSPLPLPGADRSGAGPRDAAASVRRRDLPPGCGRRPVKRGGGLRPGLPPAPSPLSRPHALALALRPSVARALAPSSPLSAPLDRDLRSDVATR